MYVNIQFCVVVTTKEGKIRLTGHIARLADTSQEICLVWINMPRTGTRGEEGNELADIQE